MDIFLLSLGCSKNQVDSERLAGIISSSGHKVVDDISSADAAIVNTCGFIAPAIEESIDAILELELLKENGDIKLLGVVGCLVNRFENELKAELKSVDFWAKAGDPGPLVKVLNAKTILVPPAALPGYSKWSRFLKISEGCDNCCSYCTIPMIRGPLVSRVPSEILDEAQFLVSGGAKEICLVGQDLTSYGRDNASGFTLTGLIEEIDRRFRGMDLWFRLLYLHPSRVDRTLIEKVASSPLFLNYLDVPVQHVAPRILASMNRGDLDREKIQKIFSSARSVDPDFALRTTIMVGYPGETEGEFESLLDFIRETGIDRVGVFPFYAEEGTTAAGMEYQIPNDVKSERIERLTLLQEEISLGRQKRFEGRTLKVLVEEVNREESYMEGRSFREAPEVDGLIEVNTEGSGNEFSPGDFVQVRVVESFEHDLLGEVAWS